LVTRVGGSPGCLLFILVAWWASRAAAQPDAEAPLPGTRPALASVRAWLQSGAGKLGEQDLLSRLGPADRIESPLPPDATARTPGDFTLVWEETSWIGIVYRAARVRRLEGHFSPHVAAQPITLDSLRRLRPGMPRKSVEQLLGNPTDDRDLRNDTRRCDWVKGVELAAHFQHGKLLRHDWIVKTRLLVPALPLSTSAAEASVAKGPATASPAEEPTLPARPGIRPQLSKDLRLWLEEGRNRLREGDVFRKMGPPDFIFNAADPDVPGAEADELGMIWRDQARIDIDFKDGRVLKLRGQFSPNTPSDQITLENFRRLKAGMNGPEVEGVLGLADEESQPAWELRRRAWRTRQEIVVYFRASKIKSVSWWGPF
jgi:hypothetical protein